MKFRNVGLLNIGMGLSMALVTLSYCIFTDNKELIAQSILGAGISVIQIIMGIKLMRSNDDSFTPKIKIMKFDQDEIRELDKSQLSDDEASIIFKLEKQNEILQSDLMKMLGLNKVKMSRLLKKLEEKDLIEKKKKGMNNLIVLK